MAHDNVDSLIDELNDYALDALDLASGSDLSSLVDNLEQLANDAAGFGGKIAQICPARIRAQKDALNNALVQVQNVCTGVAKSLDELAEVLENMPHKDLRGINGNTSRVRAKLNTQLNANQDSNGVDIQQPVMAPGADGNNDGPKSAMVQQNESKNSVWGSLVGQFRMSESKKTGFDWNSISENVDGLGIDVSETTQAPKQTLFESIISSGLPKSAGDLNSKPDPRDNYNYNSEFASVLPGEVPYQESAPIQSNTNSESIRMTESVVAQSPVNKKAYMETIQVGASTGLFDDNITETDMSSLKEAMASFKNNDDFNFEDVVLDESTDEELLSSHIVD